MKILPAIILSAFFCSASSAQSKRSLPKTINEYELLANGGFEDINTCTEFKVQCEPEAWYFLPDYIMEPQGNDSNKYEIISVGNTLSGGRPGNYLYTRLLCPLTAGKRYRFSIWVAPLKNQFDHLDVYFSYLEPNNHLALNAVTEVAFSLTYKNAAAQRHLWTQYTCTYTATGEERFITTGNFSDIPIDKTKAVAGNKHGDILYAIDNISLSPLDNTIIKCNNYYAAIKQVYDQNHRHPPRMIDRIPMDSSLIKIYKNNNLYRNITAKKNSDSLHNKIAKADTLIIPDILFHFNSSRIKPALINKLQLLVTNIRIRHFSEIEITGHTDNIGSAVFNNTLSLQRANVIQQYILANLKLPAGIVKTHGAGELQPADSNDTPEGRGKNRRVEIVLKY